MAEGRLFRVPDTPAMRRPAYVVYGASSSDQALLRLGLQELREIAEEGEEDFTEAIGTFDRPGLDGR